MKINHWFAFAHNAVAELTPIWQSDYLLAQSTFSILIYSDEKNSLIKVILYQGLSHFSKPQTKEIWAH
jgi:hypothetical protein